jgi:hypothetical protein
VVTKESASTAAAKVEAAKTTKLEAEKKRRGRGGRALLLQWRHQWSQHLRLGRLNLMRKTKPPMIHWSFENQTVRRSLSPAAKRQWSWSGRRRRMTSDKGWKRSELLLVHRRGCLF